MHIQTTTSHSAQGPCLILSVQCSICLLQWEWNCFWSGLLWRQLSCSASQRAEAGRHNEEGEWGQRWLCRLCSVSFCGEVIGGMVGVSQWFWMLCLLCAVVLSGTEWQDCWTRLWWMWWEYFWWWLCRNGIGGETLLWTSWATVLLPGQRENNVARM